MADGTHIHPAGASFWYSTDGVTYTQVFDLSEFEGPEGEKKASDDTTLQSANKLLLATPGWETFSDVPFVVYLVKAFLNTMYTHFTAGDTLYWRLLLPVIGAETNGTKWEFQGWLSKFKTMTKAAKGSDDKIMVDLSIHPTTQPLLFQGS